jgi:hypothetical protein
MPASKWSIGWDAYGAFMIPPLSIIDVEDEFFGDVREGGSDG